MRFSVDAHAIGRRLTGNEVYIRNLLRGFDDLDRDSEFIAYVSTADAVSWVPQRFRTRRVSANPFWRLGTDLAWQVKRDRPDLLHVQYTAPLNCTVPIVVSVHDVSFLEFPEFFPRPRALQLRWSVKRTIRRAARILTPSEFSRRELARAYEMTHERIEVVPPAVSSAFRPQAREAALGYVRERFGIPGPFVLTVGDLQPRKNQTGLIHAFEDLLRQYPKLPHQLVIVGKDNFQGIQVRRAALKSAAAARIHFTGFVPDRDLLQLYGATDLFVFPSLYEGFGLPVLEAMACGRAVTCSGLAAVPEVADAAAILFDPRSREQIVRAMRDLLMDCELRARMERLGMQRAALFRWDETARKTLAVYYAVAGAGGEPALTRAKWTASRQ
jgi:glycosyltransferase involved in cell wall biosynthesis